MMVARGRRAGRFSGKDGFTLIEVLVAFAVLAMITVVIQRGIVSATDVAVRAADRLQAAIVARSLMTVPLGSGAMAAGAAGPEPGVHPAARSTAAMAAAKALTRKCFMSCSLVSR